MDRFATQTQREFQSAQDRVRELIDRLTQLAESGTAAEEYFPEFLEQLVAGMQAVGGAIWRQREGQAAVIDLEYQLHLGQTQLLAEQKHVQVHAKVLQQVLRGGESLAVPPGPNLEGGNPTQCVLLLVPIRIKQQVSGVLEILQRPEVPQEAWSSQLTFLSRFAQMAEAVFQQGYVQQVEQRQEFWGQLESFLSQVHGSLEPKLVCFVLASEGRRLLDCDRVSVALPKGKSWQVQAVSGVETVEKRSALIRALQRLIRVVAKTGEVCWYTDQINDEVPPQIADALHAYVDESFVKTLGIIPLRKPCPQDSSTNTHEEDLETLGKEPPAGEIIGAFVVENFEEVEWPNGFEERTQTLAKHGSVALGNALAMHQLFLMPLWRTLGRAAWILRSQTLPKTLAVVMVLILAVSSLILVPTDFTLQGMGSLEPTVKRKVFAPVDGVVDEILVQHGQLVDSEELLAQLRNDPLELGLTSTIGEFQETQQRIQAIQATLVRSRQLPPEQQAQLTSELKTLQVTASGLEKELMLYQKQTQDLQIRSPGIGRVTTWNIEELLLARPVQRGQVLLEVADMEQPWIVEIQMPEHRMGHIAQAYAEAQENGLPLQVEFVLATDPSNTREGAVLEIAQRADLDEEEGNIVRIKVAFPPESLSPELMRPGAAVTAKVHCGQRALGYVWLHDVVDWCYREIVFRL